MGAEFNPIRKELQAIQKANLSNSVLLIDDIRCFQKSCYPEKVTQGGYGTETYPELKNLIIDILQINPHYQICFLSDALLAFPKDSNVHVSPVVRACSLHRMEHILNDVSDEDLKTADKIIGQVRDNEQQEMLSYFQAFSPGELNWGWRSYACLWRALIYRENGCEDKAQLLIDQAIKNSLPDWRANHCDERY